MNFVKGETVVQEITSDGKVRDIVTQRVKSQAEQEAEKKEEIIRNLPEFKRDRAENQGSKSLAEQLADKRAQEEEEEKAKQKEYNVHTIDEAEYEHYQLLEESERAKSRRRAVEEETAVGNFANERKRFRQEEDASGPALFQSVQHAARERAAAKQRAAPTAADRLRGLRVTVRAPAAKVSEASSAFPGVYVTENGEVIATISRDCRKLAWPDSSELAITIQGNTIKMEPDGELCIGVLANDTIKWNDGDVWRRKAAPSSEIAAAGTGVESVGAAAPSIPAPAGGGLVAYASSSDEE